MIGMFAVSESSRNIGSIDEPWEMGADEIGNVFRGMWTLTKRYPMQTLRGSCSHRHRRAAGAGADSAAWMSYAMSKCFSKEPKSSARATSKASSRPALPQKRARGRVDPGRWCSASRAIRSPRSKSACCTSRA